MRIFKLSVGANGLTKNREILLIASLAGLPRVWRMASALAGHGYHVTILEWDRSGKLLSSENVRGIRVCRLVKEAQEGRWMILGLPFWWIYITRVLLSGRFDVVQPQNLDNLIPTIACTSLTRAKIVYDLADFWESAYIPPSLRTFGKIVRWLEQSLVRTVDGLIMVSEGQVGQIGVRNVPGYATLLYNTVSTDEFPTALSSFQKTAITMLFAGSLGRDRLLPLTNLASSLKDSNRVRLVIAGFGEMEQFASKMFPEMRNVTYLGFVSHEQVMEQTASCDCVVVPYDSRLFNNRIGLASKFFEALALSKALIVQEGIMMARLVRENQCGFITDFLDKKSLRETLTEIESCDHQVLASMGARGNQLYLKQYAWPLMEVRLLHLYDRVIHGAPKTR